MGGRGSAGGVSDKGIKYGTEYRSVLAVENIKFVKYKMSKAATPPLETMSAFKNRVYVLVNKENKLKSIIFYDKSGKLRRQIDLTHGHRGMDLHVHIGYNHSGEGYPLNKSDKAYYNKVLRAWKEYNNEKS